MKKRNRKKKWILSVIESLEDLGQCNKRVTLSLLDNCNRNPPTITLINKIDTDDYDYTVVLTKDKFITIN